MKKPLIFICSPYRGDIETNLENARRYCRFAIRRGGRTSAPCIPFAPHLLFTQFLDDSIAHERELGLELGLSMLSICDTQCSLGVCLMSCISCSDRRFCHISFCL